MDVRRLNRLARQLREIALKASQDGEELPISVGQLAVFEDVARWPDSTISDIVRRTGLAQSRVSKVVGELAEEDVFLVGRDAKDKRQTRVSLDPKVRRQTFEEYGLRPIDGMVAKAAPHLSDAEVRRVIELLAELDALLQPRDPTPNGEAAGLPGAAEGS